MENNSAQFGLGLGQVTPTSHQSFRFATNLLDLIDPFRHNHITYSGIVSLLCKYKDLVQQSEQPVIELYNEACKSLGDQMIKAKINQSLQLASNLQSFQEMEYLQRFNQ